MPERKIFISYRRADNPDFADRIRDKFITFYGRDNVFIDIDSLLRGAEVVESIREAIEHSDAVIAVVGPKWVETLQERGTLHEDDFVKMELELALKLGKPITPICINGASVPSRNNLPPELYEILKRNFAFLNRTNFHEEIIRIITDLEITLGGVQETLQITSISNTGEDSASNTIKAILEIQKIINSVYKSQPPKRTSLFEELCALFLAWFAYKEHRYEKAIVKWGRILDLNPRLTSAYINRGVYRKIVNDLDGAIADFTEAIRLHPKDAIAFNNRGGLRHFRGDYDGALADYTEAIRLKPQYISPYNNRSQIRSLIGETMGAIADCQQTLKLIGNKKDSRRVEIEQRLHNLRQQLNLQS